MPRIIGWLTLAILCSVVSGCTPSGPHMVPVSGTITFNGKPLETGTIVFEPLDENLPGSNALIKNGAFSSKASPGKNKLRISSYREGKTIDPVMGSAQPVSVLPRDVKSNIGNELDIPAGGSTGLKIELTGTETQ